MDNKEGVIEYTKEVIEMLTLTEEIDVKVQVLSNEMEEVQLLVENLIHDNARRNQDKEEIIDEFSTDLWKLMIQDALVNEDGTLTFKFRNGNEERI